MWMLTTNRRPTDEQNGVFAFGSRINQLMDEALSRSPARWDDAALGSQWVPAVDVFESESEIKLVAELPGMKAQDVEISLENNLLTLRGEKKQVAEEKTERVHRYERAYGTFARTFTLPGSVDADAIEARYTDGVLTVVLPKVERARPRQIPVTTG